MPAGDDRRRRSGSRSHPTHEPEALPGLLAKLSRPWLLIVLAVAVTGLVGSLVLIKPHTDNRSLAAYCDKMRSAHALDAALAGMDPEALRPSVEALAEAVEVAPPDIEPEVALLAGVARELMMAIETQEANPTSAAAKVLDAKKDEIDRITAAGEAVETYTKDNCGFDLS